MEVFFLSLAKIQILYYIGNQFFIKFYSFYDSPYLKMQTLSLKLQATNLMLLYADKKLNGQDPEFFNTGGVASPVPRQFTLTVRLGL